MDNNEEKNPLEEPQSTGLIQPVEKIGRAHV